MSDYIAELRRELVGAAERERRRSAPRRALARWGGPLVTGIVTAAVLLAAVLGIAVLGREEPPPVAAPRIVETINVGGQPLDAAAGAGAVWVADATGRVLRIDQETRRVVVAAATAGEEVRSVAASADAVWAAVGAPNATDHGDEYRLLRIDPASNRVVARIGPAAPFGGELDLTSTAVWTQGDGQAPGPVERVDPRTNRLEHGFRARALAALVVRGDVMWTLSVTGVLERRDAGSGRLMDRLPGFAAGNDTGGTIAPDAEGAWVATPADGMLTRVSSDMSVQVRLELGVNGPIARAGRWLWVTVDDIYGRNARLVRVDPETGAETGQVRLTWAPYALVTVGADVWAVVSDGTVLVVR